MRKPQIVTIFAAIVLFSVLYFGFDTKPAKHKAIEKTRSLEGESTSFQTLLEDATAHLSPAQSEQLAALQKQLDAAGSEQDKVLIFKKISGLWYDFGQMPVAGGFAEQVAELEQADSSWSVAGGTFFNGLVNSQDPVIRQYCASHAIKAFESAASLAPEKVEHRVNLALVYAENPPPDNPMQAVLMLRDLETKHPESPSVYNALGRLAIKTGQWQKAIERLEKSWSLDNRNLNTPCLLARAYDGVGNATKATEWAERCKDR
ncbi:MAG TPA: hypothetical protein DCF33_01010 [Saprospirales bacterium]|nr:hypothetical protein [Saprospirales bacterium]